MRTRRVMSCFAVLAVVFGLSIGLGEILQEDFHVLDCEKMGCFWSGEVPPWGVCNQTTCDGSGWPSDVDECQAKGGQFAGKYGKFVFSNNSSWECDLCEVEGNGCDFSGTVLCYTNWICDDENCTVNCSKYPTSSPANCTNKPDPGE